MILCPTVYPLMSPEFMIEDPYYCELGVPISVQALIGVIKGLREVYIHGKHPSHSYSDRKQLLMGIDSLPDLEEQTKLFV